MGLVIVLRTKELTGSFASAGIASGAYALASAICAPGLGRLVDRRGPTLVLVGGALLSSLAMAVFATLSVGVSMAAIVPCAVLAGATLPPLGACLRTLWPAILGSAERVHAAFAIEAAVLETTYIAGPVLIAGAIGAWSTAASALTCAVLLLAGTLVFALTPASRDWRPPQRASDERHVGAMRAPGVRTLAVIFVLIGVAFGAVEVAVPAAAEEGASAGAAGWLLGVWGLGSFLGGLLAARAAAPADRVRRLCLLLTALAFGRVLVALPVGLVVLGALLLLAAPRSRRRSGSPTGWSKALRRRAR